MPFDGIRPVLHLPFAPGPDQPIVHDELRALVDDQIRLGVRGLVALGLASEAWTLRETERDEVLATVAAAIDGRVPFAVGIDGTTVVARDRARQAVAVGASGLMVLPPVGIRPGRALIDHFAAVADAGGVPILVQDSPQITGVAIGIDGLVAMRDADPRVGAIKIETAGAGEKASAAIAAGIEVVAGWGGQHYLESIRRGATGCMPGCDLGPALVEIDRRAREGDGAGADALYRTILPLLSYEAQSLDLLLLGAKRVLTRRGIFVSGALRAPGRGLDPEEVATLDGLIARLQADGVAGFARTAEGIAR
ncbi:MAG TPA: dihydrodipicolinate synthase family protein [Candidatus Limnocylindrales bacterium]|nr:dihydrodipicolinate synthase family protein [Candidatus Limnocylindrales bacterium]